MPLDLFVSVCAALWGPRWQTEAGAALSVSDRTIRRFVAGELPIRVGIAAELLQLVRTRQNELESLATELGARVSNGQD